MAWELVQTPTSWIPAPAKQGSTHNWKFLMVRTGPRVAHSFQPSVRARSITHNKIISMKIFATEDNAKPNIDNISGLNLAEVKLTSVHVTKLPLYHKIRKIGMICFAKPGLSEYLYIAHKEEFSITCYICDTYTWERRSLFKRDKPILSSTKMLHKASDRKGLGTKKDWLQTAVVK
jgi:hypothetical protein